jgi:hypothetical protein
MSDCAPHLPSRANAQQNEIDTLHNSPLVASLASPLRSTQPKPERNARDKRRPLLNVRANKVDEPAPKAGETVPSLCGGRTGAFRDE